MTGPRHVNDNGLWHALYQLASAYWYDVDFNGGQSVHEFYTEDGVFAVGKNRFQSQQGIKSFYDWRRARGQVTTRHLITNSIVLARDGNSAQWYCSMLVYHGWRRPVTVDFPSLVADIQAECVVGDDATAWRYASHTIDPVFIGPDTPLSLSIDPHYLSSVQSSSAG